MRRLLPYLLALLLSAGLALPAMAGPLDDARSAHARAETALADIESRRAAVDRTHEKLAGEIETLKATTGSPLLGVRDPRLDSRLKEAGALAGRLAELDRQAGAARDALDAARRTLVSTLDAELAARRAELARAPAMERRGRFEALRALIEERQTLVAAARVAPAKSAPALPAPPTDESASPDELRELADETRDHAEQVQGQMSMLEQQLAALRERQRLVRAAVAFGRDEALFVQDERNRRVVRREEGVAGAEPERTNTPTGRDADDGPAGALAGNNGDPGREADAPAPQPESPDAPPQEADNAEGGEGPPEADPQAGAEGESDRYQDDGAGADSPGGDFEMSPDPADPGPALGADGPSPEALPAGGIDDVGGVAGRTVVTDVFDPTLLDDLDDLSPEAVARRIKALEARRAKLQQTRGELEARFTDLERRADDLENE